MRFCRSAVAPTSTPLPLLNGVALAVALALGSAQAQAVEPAPAGQAQAQLLRFDIPAQPLERAVLAYAEQAGVQVLFDSARLQDLTATAVAGQLTAREALQQLIGGAPVDFRFDGINQVTLTRRAEAADDALQLPAIMVEGHELTQRQQVYLEPSSVSVIDRAQLDRTPPKHAADMLEQSAGVYTAVSQQDPGLSVNVRGLQDYGRVNMNIDGMRQNYQQSGHQQRNGTLYIDSELLSGVEVSKGATSGMGGAGVIGGVAEFRTVDARDYLADGKEMGGRLRGTTGLGGLGNGTHFIGSGIFALGNERWDLLLAGSERNLGNYEPGSNGDIGEIRTLAGTANDATDRLKNSTVDFSASETRTYLSKLGLNLSPEQRLQLSYLRTEVSYDDANLMSVTDDALWDKLGSSDITSQNLALDYSYNPANPLIDLQGKLYVVDTRNEQNNLARGSSPAYQIEYHTRTYGLQAQNTSAFNIGQRGSIDLRYGLEAFQDKVTPDSDQPVESTAVTFPYVEGMTPAGERTMGSLFAELTFEHSDWLTASAGLRYDHYWLKGETGMTIRRFTPPASFTQEALLFDVDTEEGRFSPTFGLAVKPGLDWLQLFASYGKGWRPPAVTETLIYGRPHGGGGEWMYPNPYLKPERSSAWEVGANIFRQGLFTDNDTLGIKVSYFDTRIDDFTYMAINRQIPGFGTGPTLGTVAHVNDVTSTRFRGVEYQASYDSGTVYADFTYTHMIGKNEFCSRNAYLGGAERYGFVPGVGITSIPDDAANALISCGGVMGSAEHMPMDRGALVLGTRLLNRTLDVGTRIRFSEGYTESYAERDLEAIYPADWASYVAYDFFAGYQATLNTRVSLSLENAFDRAYLVPMGDVYAFTLSRGRTLMGTLEYQF